MFPRNICILEGRSAMEPSARTPRGVAVDVASATYLGAGHVVISVAKEMNRMIRAVMAGFTRFLPMPPKSCLTTMMAAKSPMRSVQIGSPAGTLKAMSMPVSAAEQSLTVCLLLRRAFHPHSKNMQAAMDTAVRRITLNPNTTVETTREGRRHAITMSMVF